MNPDELERLEVWLRDRVHVEPPLASEQVVGGRSNLTYVLTDSSGHRWILRRPPLATTAGGAHDVLREARIIHQLAGTPVPVPAVVGVAGADSVLDVPFAVTDFVDGHVLRTSGEAEKLLQPKQRRDAALAFADSLALIHSVDVDAVGLGDLGRRDGLVARQLRRWHENWQRTRTRDLPEIDQAHQLLHGRVPEQTRVGLVHGDYRLDNCILDDGGAILAVLDWELSALGDPAVDVGIALAYWAEPGDELVPLEDTATLAAGMPTRAELVDRYCATAGVDVPQLDFYFAFAWWRLACIVENVYTRMAAGVMGRSDRTAESFGAQSLHIAKHALDLARAL